MKDKIAAIASEAVKSDRAKAVSDATGAGIYWMNAADAAARIDQDYAAAEELVKT